MARAGATVEGYLAGLDPDRRPLVEAVLTLLREVEPELVESIKWNAPSCAFQGRDRITFAPHDRQGRARLVLHMGTGRAEDRAAPPVLDDPAGLVAWSSDIRGVLTIADLAALEADRAAIADVVRRWLAVAV